MLIPKDPATNEFVVFVFLISGDTIAAAAVAAGDVVGRFIIFSFFNNFYVISNLQMKKQANKQKNILYYWELFKHKNIKKIINKKSTKKQQQKWAGRMDNKWVGVSQC